MYINLLLKGRSLNCLLTFDVLSSCCDLASTEFHVSAKCVPYGHTSSEKVLIFMCLFSQLKCRREGKRRCSTDLGGEGSGGGSGAGVCVGRCVTGATINLVEKGGATIGRGREWGCRSGCMIKGLVNCVTDGQKNGVGWCDLHFDCL